MAESVRERCQRRLAGLRASRQEFESAWTQIAKLAAPSRTRFVNSKAKRPPLVPDSLRDEHGIFAFRTLASGMTSGLSSPSRPWFALATTDDLMEDYEVKTWLSDCEERLYSFLARTNFYGAAKTGYAELGLFGTEACVMVEHPIMGAVCHPLTVGEYWIATSDALQADTLYRRVPMTVKQAVDRFGGRTSSRVRDRYDRSAYDEIVPVFHAIEPNHGRDERKIDGPNKPWRSIYWDEQDDSKTTLEEGGYDEQPFWAPRWETVGNDPWGYSPGMDALPSMRELQYHVKRRNEAVDLLVNPEKLVKAGVKLTGQPGNVVSVPGIDQNMVATAYQMPYQTPGVIGEQIERLEQKIDKAAYADLFMAITNMQGVQPRNVEEIASRNEEKLTQLGPVIERVNTEKLEVAIDRVFGIMQRGRLLPPPPPTLHGVNIETTFVSILAQMQRMVGIGQIERTAGFVGNLIAAFPEAGDKLDVDEMIDEYADRAGAPQKIIRTADMVATIRQDRAQAQQQQKMMEAMPAVQQGADAARLLSETDAGGGQSMLERMLPA